jgi:hypothetical protein
MSALLLLCNSVHEECVFDTSTGINLFRLATAPHPERAVHLFCSSSRVRMLTCLPIRALPWLWQCLYACLDTVAVP